MQTGETIGKGRALVGLASPGRWLRGRKHVNAELEAYADMPGRSRMRDVFMPPSARPYRKAPKSGARKWRQVHRKTAPKKLSARARYRRKWRARC